MFFDALTKPVVEEIKSDLLFDKGITLFVLRLDLIHPITGGNKLFKLKYNLQKAKEEKRDTLLTFGGAFSNHIAATAMAGKENGFKTIGIIRRDKVLPLNKTLQFAQECGMQLEFISREDYRKKETSEFIHSYVQKFNPFYLIPEGGSNELAIKGCSEIIKFINIPFDYICSAVGTGTTLQGIVSSLKPNQTAIGISVSKDKSVIEKLHSAYCQLFSDYVFGGYAKATPELTDFVTDFNQITGIIIEPIYTGKLFFGIYDLIKRNYLKKGSTVVVIHTGGLQYLST